MPGKAVGSHRADGTTSWCYPKSSSPLLLCPRARGLLGPRHRTSPRLPSESCVIPSLQVRAPTERAACPRALPPGRAPRNRTPQGGTRGRLTLAGAAGPRTQPRPQLTPAARPRAPAPPAHRGDVTTTSCQSAGSPPPPGAHSGHTPRRVRAAGSGGGDASG